jgi:hypothetical protein
MKKEDVDRVVKEVNDNLKAGWVYPYNFIKTDCLRYGYLIFTKSNFPLVAFLIL